MWAMSKIFIKMVYFLSSLHIIGSNGLENIPVQDSKIINGKPVTIADVPYLAAVEVDGNFRCGASILSPHWLISSAGCYSDVKNPTRSLKVRIGTTFLKREGLTYDLQQYVPHPNFTDKVKPPLNDLVLLQTATIMQFDKNKKPIGLADPQFVIKPGQDVTIYGWGNRVRAGALSDNIQSATIKVVNETVCNDAYKEYQKNPGFKMSPDTFCASNEVSAPCAGDGGGPGVIDKRLAGIMSANVNTGIQCSVQKFPLFLTKLSAFTAWIKKITGM